MRCCRNAAGGLSVIPWHAPKPAQLSGSAAAFIPVVFPKQYLTVKADMLRIVSN